MKVHIIKPLQFTAFQILRALLLYWRCRLAHDHRVARSTLPRTRRPFAMLASIEVVRVANFGKIPGVHAHPAAASHENDPPSTKDLVGGLAKPAHAANTNGMLVVSAPTTLTGRASKGEQGL